MALERLLLEMGARGQEIARRSVSVLEGALFRLQARMEALRATAAQPLIDPTLLRRVARDIVTTGDRINLVNRQLSIFRAVPLEAASSFSRLGGSILSVGRAVLSVMRPFNVWIAMMNIRMFAAVGQAVVEFAKLGGSVEVAGQVFEVTAQKMGTVSQEFLPRLEKATLGTISKFELMRLANFAMNAGLEISSEQFEKLSEAAIKLGAVTGRDATEALQRLTFGIVKQERRILDELGIVLRAKDVFAEYAASIGKASTELTGQEKVQAFLGSTLDAVNDKLSAYTDINFDSALAGQKAAVQFENVKNRLSEIFVESGAAAKLMEVFASILGEVEEFFKDPDTVSNFFDVIISGAKVILSLLKAVLEILTAIAPVIKLISDAISAVAGFVSGVVSVIKAPIRAIASLFDGDGEAPAAPAAPVSPSQVGREIGEAVEPAFAMTGSGLREVKRVVRNMSIEGVGEFGPALV